jgi:hypothetical protein
MNGALGVRALPGNDAISNCNWHKTVVAEAGLLVFNPKSKRKWSRLMPVAATIGNQQRTRVFQQIPQP